MIKQEVDQVLLNGAKQREDRMAFVFAFCKLLGGLRVGRCTPSPPPAITTAAEHRMFPQHLNWTSLVAYTAVDTLETMASL